MILAVEGDIKPNFDFAMLRMNVKLDVHFVR